MYATILGYEFTSCEERRLNPSDANMTKKVTDLSDKAQNDIVSFINRMLSHNLHERPSALNTVEFFTFMLNSVLTRALSF